LYKANGRELNRYPWLQQEKIPSAEPDHREKENDLRKLNKLKARLSGRFGASVPQPCFDLVRLARKETVYS
jgi:hypothetical protein